MNIREHGVSFFLLRGLSREVRHWGSFPEILLKSSNLFHVVPLEVPGTGRLREEKSPAQADHYVDIIRNQYLAHRKIGNINILIGMSLGGMIAASWAKAYPSDFHGAVLINTSSSISPPLKRLRPSAAITLVSTLLSGNSIGREKKIANLVCNLADSNAISRQWAEISDSAPVSTVNKLRQLLAAVTFSLPPKADVPILLLSSRHDRLVSSICSEDIANRWQIGQGELVYHSTAGHDLTTDDPQWCVNTLHHWLANQDVFQLMSKSS